MSFEACIWGRKVASLESRRKASVGGEGRAWTQFECEGGREAYLLETGQHASTEFRKFPGVPGKPDWLEEKMEGVELCLWRFASQSQIQAKTSTPGFSKLGEKHLVS